MRIRLTVFATIFLVTMTTVVAIAAAKCSDPRVRKEIRDLTDDERERYIYAVKKVYDEGWLDNLTENHFTSGANVHGVPVFFPWHRQFIWDYENLLRKVDSEITLPYWDWTLDAAKPPLSQVFHSNYMGGSGNPNQLNCLMNGPFRYWQVTTTVPHCLQRNFNMTQQFWGPDVLLEVQRNSQMYSDLQPLIENTIHAIIHLFIGGDMAQLISTNDPIFFLHHAMVDKVWYDWQLMGEDSKRFHEYNGIDRTRSNVTVNPTDPLPEYTHLSVSDVLNPMGDLLCYKYAESKSQRSALALFDRYNRGNPPQSQDEAVGIIASVLGYNPDAIDLSILTEEERTLKPHTGNPDWWNRQHNLDGDMVANSYEIATGILQQLNQLANYISPCVVQLAYVKAFGPRNPEDGVEPPPSGIGAGGVFQNTVNVATITGPPTVTISIGNVATIEDRQAEEVKTFGGIFATLSLDGGISATQQSLSNGISSTQPSW
ncbi:hypothetical protein EV182_001422 [Spiromyces aspiralis]|uniref:Uncharacterized protein n=1 Tax=Spiromyces aspiralis TaxID=68401 RepID=A0ACC1HGN9_9FUNG|nr:hypothetical protein EV182_001422 [Spiromyces aspiralis]